MVVATLHPSGVFTGHNFYPCQLNQVIEIPGLHLHIPADLDIDKIQAVLLQQMYSITSNTMQAFFTNICERNAHSKQQLTSSVLL